MTINVNKLSNFSIIIITRNRPRLLENCLTSLCHSIQASDINQYEIILVFNGEQIESQNTILNLKISHLKVITLSKAITPAKARNIAIKKAHYPYLCFLDDDTILPLDYFAKSLQSIADNQYPDVIGGVENLYPNSTPFEESLHLTLASPIATAHTRHRHSPGFSQIKRGCESNLILCNLWIKRKLFSQFKLSFPEKFQRNEENLLLELIQKQGFRLIRDERIQLFHKKKSNWGELFLAVYKSGFYRSHCFILNPTIKSLIYFAPMILIFSAIFSFFYLKFSSIFILLSSYLLLVTFFSLRVISYLKKINRFHLVFRQTIFINFVYGIGLITGFLFLIRFLFHQPTLRDLGKNDHSLN